MNRRILYGITVVAVGLAAACSSSSTTTTKPSSTTTAPAAGPSASSSPTTAPAAAAACTPARPGAKKGISTHTFTYDGKERTYLTYVPKGYDGTQAVPVVFEFHGFGSNAQQQIVYGNFMPEADKDPFLIVAPDGGELAGGRHFDLVKDVGMTSALLDQLEKDYCVDAKRVYATGMSDGGAMTSFLACRLNDRIAAFGPVALTVQPTAGCKPGKAPIMSFHGTADPVVQFNGGKVRCCGGITLPSIPSASAAWAKRNGCATTPTDTKVGTEVTKRTFPGCTNGDVTLYIINGGGHTWPGATFVRPALGKVTKQIDAGKTLWDFFKTQSLS